MFFNGIIYKATNTINNKCYVGQTRQSLCKRKASHKQDSKTDDTYFCRAIRKYGWESFTWEIVDTFTTVEEGDTKESQQIVANNSMYNQQGYNILPGGSGFRALHLSDETKKKMSEASKKKWADPEFKSKMLEAHKHRNKPISIRVVSVEEANKFGARMKQLWQDVEFRDRVLKSRKQSITSQRRLLVSNQMKSLWQDPEFRFKMSLIKTQTPESIEKRRQSMLKRWQDPEYKIKQSTAFNRAQQLRRNNKTNLKDLQCTVV